MYPILIFFLLLKYVREEGNRSLYYKKDISILARSGFSYEISKRVLEIPKVELKNFVK